MKFLEHKLSDGLNKSKTAKFCRWLKVSRQGFYKYLKRPKFKWRHEDLAEEILTIIKEDDWNDNYGKKRIWEALKLRHSDGNLPSITTIYRIISQMGICRKKKHNPNGITKADKEARKSDDLLKRDFIADKPFTKCVTDITMIPVKGGRLYVSAIFDCYHLECLGLAMDTNMKSELCIRTLADAKNRHPELRGAIVHSDRGSQYTSHEYREALRRHGFIQSIS